MDWPSFTPVHASSRRSAGALLYVVVLLALLVAAFLLGRASTRHAPLPAANLVADDAKLAHPGPWGTLEYMRILISPPEEFLSVRSAETNTHWFFGNYSHENLDKLLDSLSLSTNHKHQLLSPPSLQILTNGLLVTPSHDIVVSLSPKARDQLHRVLAQFPENPLHRNPFYFGENTFDDFFARSGLSDTTLALVKQLCCSDRKCLYFSDLPAVLERTPSYDERVRLIRALSRRTTLLVNLHITADSDIDALAAYWAKAGCAKNLAPVLKSLKQKTGGARLDLVELLPPLPTALLYSFPLPATTSMWSKGKEDCHWSSFNFFSDPPDDRYSDPSFVSKKLAEEYEQVAADPRYGDVVVLLKPNGEIIHSAVFLADNIVFTKNGGHYLQPWMLNTIPELLDTYTFQTPPDQSLQVRYYRKKS